MHRCRRLLGYGREAALEIEGFMMRHCGRCWTAETAQALARGSRGRQRSVVAGKRYAPIQARLPIRRVVSPLVA